MEENQHIEDAAQHEQDAARHTQMAAQSEIEAATAATHAGEHGPNRNADLRKMLHERWREVQDEVESRIRDARTDRLKVGGDDLERSHALFSDVVSS